ncbi:MAG: tetratricopeptide repeat protein [Polyangia bacterium]
MWLRRLALLLVLLWVPLGHAADVLPGPTGKNKIQQLHRLKENARILYYAALKHRRRDHPERISQTQQAIQLLYKALQIEPTDVEARVWLGEWLSRPELGPAALVQAVKELQRARQDDDAGSWDFEIATQLGIVLSHMGRFTEAVTEYDRALRLLPGEPDSLLFPSRHQQATLLSNSAEALMAMGKLEQAIRRYHQAEQIDTGDQGALHAMGLAIAYDRDSQVQKAARRSVDRWPPIRGRISRAMKCSLFPTAIATITMGLSRKRWAIATKRCEHSVSSFRSCPRAVMRHGPVNTLRSCKNCLAYRRKSFCAQTSWSGRHTLPRKTAAVAAKNTAAKTKCGGPCRSG